MLYTIGKLNYLGVRKTMLTRFCVIFKIYDPPSQRLQISQYHFFEKNEKKTRQITWLKGVTTFYSFDLFDLK